MSSEGGCKVDVEEAFLTDSLLIDVSAVVVEEEVYLLDGVYSVDIDLGFLPIRVVEVPIMRDPVRQIVEELLADSGLEETCLARARTKLCLMLCL